MNDIRTNFQRHLDRNKDEAASQWEHELKSLDMTGDYSLEDAQKFLQATTKKSVSSWAVSLELTTRHKAMQKIISSL